MDLAFFIAGVVILGAYTFGVIVTLTEISKQLRKIIELLDR